MKQATPDPQEETVIWFEEGVIGVPRARRFELLERSGSRLLVLHSLDIEGFDLPLVDPRLADPDYTPQFAPHVAELLQAVPDEPLLTLAVTALGPEGPLANLRAPVVINVRKRLAVQVILESDYPLRAPVTSVTQAEPIVADR